MTAASRSPIPAVGRTQDSTDTAWVGDKWASCRAYAWPLASSNRVETSPSKTPGPVRSTLPV